jgi:UDP:flavonoid glycosyltransferase YjiC (YdhE family)
MRVLFVTSPGIGHLFPTISLAHALRAAGHEVLYALGGYATTAAEAGMPVFDTAPGVDFSQIFREFVRDSQQPPPGDEARPRWAARLFSRVSQATIDGSVEAGLAWQPDLVVHTPLQGAGPLVAAKLGVPALEHGFNFGTATEITKLIRDELSEFYDKHGAPADPPTTMRLTVAPPSMYHGDAEQAWAMRYVPYNGGGVLPDWLLTEPDRPRIAVSLGSVVPHMAGTGGLSSVLAAASETGAEVVLALGNADTAALGDLPDNVRLCQGWIPFNALLKTCTAAMHHGGAGTTLTTLDAGVPQIVLPQFADQHANADAVNARGAGRIAELATVSTEDIEQLLTDEGIRTAATEVQAEMATMPAPSEIVPRLVGLAESGRR